MNPIDRLIEADAKTKKRIAVLGCSMEDRYVHGDILPSQDGVMKFVERRTVSTPGGAAGASRQLFHWNAHVELISLVGKGDDSEAWNQIGIGAKEVRRMPKKVRFLLDDQGRIVWRHDLDNGYGLDANGMKDVRSEAHAAIFNRNYDAVLISDYEKGFVNEDLISKVIRCCNKKGIPVVADAKRRPELYIGSIFKCNREYINFYDPPDGFTDRLVLTEGKKGPTFGENGNVASIPNGFPVQCVNHVGAGDCFSAHLTLALAHGFSLEEAATLAHSAGRIYVQHLHGRPPWPHEIKKDLDPVGGKVVISDALTALRRSSSGRIGFAPGVFRFIHAGHAAFLEWAKSQCDVLVVGVNSDASAKALRPWKAVLPLEERVRLIASMSAVDWVVVFDDSHPAKVIENLKPDIMAKGHDYGDMPISCAEMVKDIRIAPESAFRRHCSDYSSLG